MPKFSIIIPTFNRANSIVESINSILCQSFQDWEVVIIDDGSIDGTQDIIQPFLVNEKIKYLFQFNEGVSAARNKGVNIARGEFLIFLDSDDQLTEDTLQIFQKAILEQPFNNVYTAGFVKVGQNGTIMLIKVPSKVEDISNLSGTFTIRKCDFILAGLYDPLLKFSENSELFHRFYTLNYRFHIIPIATLIYNDDPHGGSKNLRNSSEAISYILVKHEASLSRRVKGLYWKVLGINNIRFRDYGAARKALWNALRNDPLNFDILLRFVIAMIPFAANVIYTKVT